MEFLVLELVHHSSHVLRHQLILPAVHLLAEGFLRKLLLDELLVFGLVGMFLSHRALQRKRPASTEVETSLVSGSASTYYRLGLRVLKQSMRSGSQGCQGLYTNTLTCGLSGEGQALLETDRDSTAKSFTVQAFEEIWEGFAHIDTQFGCGATWADLGVVQGLAHDSLTIGAPPLPTAALGGSCPDALRPAGETVCPIPISCCALSLSVIVSGTRISIGGGIGVPSGFFG